MTTDRPVGGTFPERLGQANLDMLLGFEKHFHQQTGVGLAFLFL